MERTITRDHVPLKCQNRQHGTDSGKAKSALIVTPRARVFSDQYQGEMLRSENNGTPFEGLEEIVFEKLLTSSPNRWRNEP
jgi:hypothetical protein